MLTKYIRITMTGCHMELCATQSNNARHKLTVLMALFSFLTDLINAWSRDVKSIFSNTKQLNCSLKKNSCFDHNFILSVSCDNEIVPLKLQMTADYCPLGLL